jgi:hypothetical protein
VAYALTEVEVKSAGQVGLKVNGKDGLSLWIDGKPVDVADRVEVELGEGRHSVVFRVDLTKRTAGLRAELVKVNGSEAEAAVVGGP